MKTNWFGRYKSDCWPLAILGGFIILANLAGAQPLTGEAAPSLQWQAVASSADGNLFLAAANTASPSNSSNVPVASIYISTNAGATWNPTPAPADLWQSVAVSANGAKMIAAASISFQNGDPPAISGDGLIYTSANSGATWMPASAPNNAWSCVASSADGSRLLAAASLLRPSGYGVVVSGDGLIYSSTNGGVTWNATSAPSDNWKSIACSSDGTRLVAAVDVSVSTGAGLIYLSTNSGLTWMQAFTGKGFTSVASSADGTRLVAADPCACFWNGFECLGVYCPSFDNHIYVSTNSGATWTETGAPGATWESVVSSADGLTLAAACHVTATLSPGGVFLSQDGGASWVLTSLGDSFWTAMACSADGRRLVAASGDGRLTTLPYVGAWRTATVPAVPWSAVASSEDGTKLIAVAAGDGTYIYSSTNSGVPWAETSALADLWQALAISPDGAKMVAAAGTFWGVATPTGVSGVSFDGLIYTSTNSGATWTQTTAPSLSWAAVASSADGTRLVAAPQDGTLYLSSDSGVSFTSSGPTNSWSSVASSADGMRLVGASDVIYGDGLIYISSNSGTTWRPTSAPINRWSSVASSADGAQLIAAAEYEFVTGTGLIYLSRDAGVSWSPTAAPNAGWNSVTSSADGAVLVAVASPWVYISTDSGATWSIPDMPGSGWTAAVVSASGANILALSDLGTAGILHWPLPPPTPPPSPLVSIAQTGANASLSWIIPSPRFTLQQTSGLTSPNWLDITNQPALNLNNLRNEVTLPRSPGHTFYRLKRQ